MGFVLQTLVGLSYPPVAVALFFLALLFRGVPVTSLRPHPNIAKGWARVAILGGESISRASRVFFGCSWGILTEGVRQ